MRSVKNAENFVSAGEMLPLLVRPSHVTPQNVRLFIEQDRQMTRPDFSTLAGDQRREAMRVNESVDRLSIFYAIE
jgi:hypothetical protein